jgi:heat shock protein HtpX
VVEEMAIAAGMPKPRVAVIETDALNAFATGMRADKAAIGVTRGLLEKLDRDELQGVIGHEMGHILNLDIRYMTAVGILVGLIALVSDAVLRGRWRPGFGGKGKGKGGGVIIFIIVLAVVILAPIAAKLVQFAVSRQREYLADATSVQLTRNPLGLIGALHKLEHQKPVRELGNRATQHMFIVNPIREFGADVSALIATHPPTEARIQRLENLGKA